jgi:hypothetical protein
MVRRREMAGLVANRNRVVLYARVLVIIFVAVASALALVAAPCGNAQPQISVQVLRAVHLAGSQPLIVQASLLPGGSFAVFSERITEDFTSLGIFSAAGELVKNLAGTNVPTGLSRLSSLHVDRGGILWASTLDPGGVARLNQNGLISAGKLSKLKVAYGLALDEAHGYVYVSGAPVDNPGADSSLLLIHQFAIDDLKFRKSFLQMDPSVLDNGQIGIQSVPLDVDKRGIVWAVDSPAFRLYSIDPVSGRRTSIPIRSRVATPAGKLDPLGGGSYTREYIESAFIPESVIADGNRIIVAIRRPGEITAAHYLLEIFDSTGVQIGVDIPAPGRLVGKYVGGLLFGGVEKAGATIIEGVLSNPVHSQR